MAGWRLTSSGEGEYVFDDPIQSTGPGAATRYPEAVTLPDMGCQWLVRKPSNNPEPDFPSDCWIEEECGEPVDASAKRPLCRFHEELMAMPETDFEAWVEMKEDARW